MRDQSAEYQSRIMRPEISRYRCFWPFLLVSSRTDDKTLMTVGNNNDGALLWCLLLGSQTSALLMSIDGEREDLLRTYGSANKLLFLP